MRLDKRIASIVITYEDMECVRYTGVDAIQIQELIKKYISHYFMARASGLLANALEDGGELSRISYELIRKALTDDEIIKR